MVKFKRDTEPTPLSCKVVSRGNLDYGLGIFGDCTGKNPSLGMKAESITVDIRNKSLRFKHDLIQEQPLTIAAQNALFTVYKHSWVSVIW